jgi:hypothetical protein
MKDLKKIQEFFSKPLEENALAKFTDYSNNELAAYCKNNPTDRKAAKELHKRSQALKGLTRTDVNEGAVEIMDAYNNVMDLVKKHSRNLSDDDSYAFGLKLKAWFNKNILDEASRMSLEEQQAEWKARYGSMDGFDKAYPQYSGSMDHSGKVKNEAKEEDKIDIVTMDVPLFIRALEYAKEDAQEDMDLHDFAERAIAATKEQGILQMDDYDMLVGDLKQIAMEGELTEAYVPSNITEFAKRKGISSLVRKVAGWAERVGARITGGNAIGKGYNTLILDMGYQTADIRIDVEDETIELYYKPVNSFADFKNVFMEKESRKQAEHDEETLRRERGLEEEEKGYSKFLVSKDNPKGETKGLTPKTLNKILTKVANDLNELKQLGEGVIEEELCDKGKRYIKARQAAGEKSSAYLSGRAVKVCKGQIEWPKKGKKK